MITAWEVEAKRHWTKHRPRLVKYLREKGVLRQALEQAAENAGLTFGAMARRGVDPWEAQREARIQFLLLPDEESVPMLDPDQAPFGQPEPIGMDNGKRHGPDPEVDPADLRLVDRLEESGALDDFDPLQLLHGIDEGGLDRLMESPVLWPMVEDRLQEWAVEEVERLRQKRRVRELRRVREQKQERFSLYLALVFLGAANALAVITVPLILLVLNAAVLVYLFAEFGDRAYYQIVWRLKLKPKPPVSMEGARDPNAELAVFLAFGCFMGMLLFAIGRSTYFF